MQGSSQEMSSSYESGLVTAVIVIAAITQGGKDKSQGFCSPRLHTTWNKNFQIYKEPSVEAGPQSSYCKHQMENQISKVTPRRCVFSPLYRFSLWKDLKMWMYIEPFHLSTEEFA